MTLPQKNCSRIKTPSSKSLILHVSDILLVLEYKTLKLKQMTFGLVSEIVLYKDIKIKET